MQCQQPLQLGDRIRGVVDPDVDESVVRPEVAAVLPNHEQGGRLHPALVAATRLPRLERRQQAVRELTAALLEALGQVLHRLVGHHDVRLRGDSPPHDDLAPCRPRRPRRGGRPTRPPAQSKVRVPVKLAALPCASTMPTWRSCSIVSLRMMIRSASSAVAPCAMRAKALLAVGGVAETLRGHGADAARRPGNDAADVGELGLHRHAQIAGGRVLGDDAVGVGELMEVAGRSEGLLSGER